MVNLFETGQDLYVHVGKIAFPDLDWGLKAVKKAKRPIFKQVLLGSLYGMGINTLSRNSGVSVDEAKRLHDVMFNEFSVLREYTDKLFKYPLSHEGYINTFYGDKLKSSSWRYVRTPDGKVDSGAEARVIRHGCNYCIQNGSAITLASGFWNNIRVAKKYGITLEPIICVHDSSTTYFPAGFMPWLRLFYDENFTEYSRQFTGIPFLYDLFVGANYDDCCLAVQKAQDTVEISGSNDAILKILNKLDEAGVEYALNKDRRDIIPEYVENPIERFIRSSVNTCIQLDISENTVEIKFNLNQYNWGWKPSK